MHPTIYETRKNQHSFEKKCLGIFAAHYLREKAMFLPIAIDGGSTNLYVIKEIQADITNGSTTVSQVLTNHVEGIYLAQALAESETIWRCTGGVLRPSRMTFVEADSAVNNCRFSIAVVGANGFQAPWLNTQTEREQPMKKAMIQGATEEVIFPIDSSKWGHPGGMTLHTVNEITSWGKKVLVVSCYPVRDTDEPEDMFEKRLKRFLHTADKLVSVCERTVGLFTAKVDCAERRVSPECPVKLQPGEVEAEFRSSHGRMLAHSVGNTCGLIIGFLCSPEAR